MDHGYRDNPMNWSFPLFKLSGIQVRIHLLFVLWILFELLRSIQDGTVSVWAVIATTFFVVVLVHEFGHCIGARSVGGDAQEILMWPLGGLAYAQAPMTPRAQFITTAAGPLVNVVFCVVTAPLVLWLGGAAALPLNPFSPFAVSNLSPLSWGISDWLGVFWSVNYLLLLFNLLPVFPMDGGRLLQAVIWKYKGFQFATLMATFVGMLGAIGFGFVGLVNQNMTLVAIAIFGYITCMQQRHLLKAGLLTAENEWGYELSQSLGDFEEAAAGKPSWFTRRRTARLARLAERRRREEIELEAQIDAILEKVHRHGMHSLTAREKKLLRMESQRKRQL